MGDMDTVEILHELRLIRLQLDAIQRDLSDLKRHQQHVNAHVDFVQHVYDRIKRPFHRVIHWVDYMTTASATNRQFLTDQEGDLQSAVQGIRGMDVGDRNDK